MSSDLEEKMNKCLESEIRILTENARTHNAMGQIKPAEQAMQMVEQLHRILLERRKADADDFCCGPYR